MDLGGYLKVFRERWIAIALCFLLGVGSALAVTALAVPTYQANALLFLKVTADSGSLFDRSQFSVQRVKSYPDLVDSPSVLQPVIDDLHLATTPQLLASRVSATNPIDTVALRVTATDSNPEQAASIANAVSTQLSKEVSGLEAAATNSKASTSSVQLVLTVPATTPKAPLSPNRTLNLVIGALAGLAAGLILAILLAVGDRRLRTPQDVRRVGGLPLAGQIPRGRRGWTPLISRLRAGDAIAPYQEVLTNIGLLSGGRLPRLLVLAPSTSGGPAKHLRLRLAEAVAASGRTAVVLEADSSADKELPTEIRGREIGVVDVLTGSESVGAATVYSGGVAVLPVGSAPLPTRTVVADGLEPLLRELEDRHDVTIAHPEQESRPIDLTLIAREADATVVVIEYGRTRPSDIGRVLSVLELSDIHPIGVLMLGVPRWRRAVVPETWEPEDVVRTPRKSGRLRKVTQTDLGAKKPGAGRPVESLG